MVVSHHGTTEYKIVTSLVFVANVNTSLLRLYVSPRFGIAAILMSYHKYFFAVTFNGPTQNAFAFKV